MFINIHIMYSIGYVEYRENNTEYRKCQMVTGVLKKNKSD